MKTAAKTSRHVSLTTTPADCGSAGHRPRTARRRPLHACPLTVTTLVLVLGSLVSAADYTFYSGLNDSDYAKAKYMQFGWIDALDELGLTRTRYQEMVPWCWYENAVVPSYRTYEIPQFDSSDRGADYSTLTVCVCHSGTFKDVAANEFFFAMATQYEFKGTPYVTSGVVGLGEAKGYFVDDDYAGNCRYVMALGCNAVAMGPAMADEGHPTYSHPELFDAGNSNHANPLKIWGPAMTNGVRQVWGYTDYSNFSGTGDRDKYKKFAEHVKSGDSLAGAFARVSRDAFPWQKPVVLVRGATEAECTSIAQERTFTDSRPTGMGYMQVYVWSEGRQRDYDGPYTWKTTTGQVHGPKGVHTLAAETSVFPVMFLLYTTQNSPDRQSAALLRYLKMLGVANKGVLPGQTNNRMMLYKVDEGQTVAIDPRRGSLCYHNAEAAKECTGPCQLTEQECVDRAVALLADNHIIAPEELYVDSVIACRCMGATAAEIASNTYTSRPEVIRYTVVLKRNMGELPILTNDTDTIAVELGADGRLVSLTSDYAYGRTLARRLSVTPRFRTLDEAKRRFSAAGAVHGVRAGLLPTEEGTYVPVYEVLSKTTDSGLTGRLEVNYYRMDTLEPVTQGQDEEGYELERDTAPLQVG